MKKVLTVFGTRPEAIKMAPVVLELNRSEHLESVVCVTAQHREMLDQVLGVFKIKPDFDLDLMKTEQSLTSLTQAVLGGMQEIIAEVQPDVVLVHGDTTTTFATATAAFYAKVPIGHVEAGLRTYDKYAPFPEEINREFVSLVAAYNFAPTEKAAENLRAERRRPETIFVTGNTAIDALKTTVGKDFQAQGKFAEALNWLGNSRLVLLTAHRRENWGEPLRQIFRAVRRLAEDLQDVKVIYPVHLNPAVRKAAEAVLGDCPKVRLIEPLEVVEFHNLMNRAEIILTDSGGIQEEAPSLGKPVLVMRETTERPEGVEAGTLRLVGTDTTRIYETAYRLLTDEILYAKMAQAKNPYGDGEAAKRIVKILEESL